MNIEYNNYLYLDDNYLSKHEVDKILQEALTDEPQDEILGID